MIFFDIETVPSAKATLAKQWVDHCRRLDICNRTVEAGTERTKQASLHPAFCQVVCICAESDYGSALYECGADERGVLAKFAQFVGSDASAVLCGHNIKSFDIPVLACRYLAHGMRLPPALQVLGKKPWEIQHVDTCELLRFGGGPRISLDAACLMLGIDSPKDSMAGSDVAEAFAAGRFADIAAYCAGDVLAVRKIVECLNEIGATGTVSGRSRAPQSRMPLNQGHGR